MMTSANICHHFGIFFYELKDYMLVIIRVKFEVNSCCNLDFKHAQTLP